MSPTAEPDDQTLDGVAPMPDDHLSPGPPAEALATGVNSDPGTQLTWHDRLRAVWNAIAGGIGLLLGLLPHVLHHVAFLAGTALVAGSGGTALFGALGLLASIPFLLRLRRRFGTWRAPAIGLLIFAAMFSLSTFVIGPSISGASDGGGAKPGPVPSVDHTGHHT